jgi:CheY-like chemotaxis protein
MTRQSQVSGGFMEAFEKKRVLIVDNSAEALQTLQGVLEKAGFDTQTTWSGREALALLKSGEFDVLLVDDYLPDLHSGDFITQVVMLPIQPGIVVMQAAVPTANQLLRYASLGTSGVVPKHHLAEVCKAVATCCRTEPLVNTSVN